MSLIEQIVSKIFHPQKAEATPASTGPQTGQVDVEAVVSKLAESKHLNLNWKSSIVDLLKVLGMDSGLEARKRLAQELNYNGNANDTAAMNVWLIHKVMEKLAQNGGRIPEELKH
jgi:hypothetical protein